MSVAVVTGASRGLGLALAEALADRGWSLVIDARRAEALAKVRVQLVGRLVPGASLTALPGDVSDAGHRRELVRAAERLGGLDLLVNNASDLGATPLPPLAGYPLDSLRRVFDVNVLAPLGLVQEAHRLLHLSRDPAILNVTSDASVEAYEGWGGYGASKAALDYLSAVLAVEDPDLRVWVVDPGDMRTQMHQDAFPGEDISDRPHPESVVPRLLTLLDRRPPSGRYRAADLDAAGQRAQS
jgi:NAD(P)-dependent dehydrogenase (short-subunit alcohol dehydrogenase family)